MLAYAFMVEHISDTDNIVADAMSRIPGSPFLLALTSQDVVSDKREFFADIPFAQTPRRRSWRLFGGCNLKAILASSTHAHSSIVKGITGKVSVNMLQTL